MTMIGVLGGMGPLATVDFMAKVISLTCAESDQQHVPMMVANLPQIPDRSRSILNGDEAPLPYLLKGIDLLNGNEVGLIAIPCNSSHHWYAQMCARSAAPVLHIAQTCVDAVPAGISRAAVLATRGALASGFYQQALAARDIEPVVPDDATQLGLDACIRDIKAGRLAEGSAALADVLDALAGSGVQAAIMGCTEIPVAAQQLGETRFTLIDSTLELARATVAYATERGWNRF
ncbi:cysteate racemase [Paraburkholderia saeva]|jgi:aspartate racemase|uniref:Aspartate racemase n=1 Tax=Paraburkholderia saeva TaxID=2777537 RepID=A0A9N8RYI2_9BURK|nr:amino acid racemase [Paraburkholderia saeva]CAG4890039.1 Aspartate racemase [Paraburkholderia saeva]CAG4897687.1 Aspartate racemase [Paraburkholderia saeva]CAG4912620.1 Aspartate racemase [Paraburkholderia saeva]